MQGIFKNNAAIRSLCDNNGFITGTIRVELEDAVNNDLEGFMDLLSERLIGSIFGMETNYEVVGFEPTANTLLVEVTLNATLHLIDDDDDDK